MLGKHTIHGSYGNRDGNVKILSFYSILDRFCFLLADKIEIYARVDKLVGAPMCFLKH